MSETRERLRKLGLVVMPTAWDDDDGRVLEIRKRNETGIVFEVVGRCRNDAEVEAWLDGFESSHWGGDETKDQDVVERLKHHDLVLVDGGDRVFEIKEPGKRPFSVGELIRQCHTKREVEAWLDGFETRPITA